MKASGRYVPIYAAITSSPKLLDLADALDVPAPTALGHLVWLLATLVEQAPEGRLASAGRPWTARRIAQLGGWTGDAEVFCTALVTCGWLDQDGDALACHEWDLYGGRSCERMTKDAARQREKRSASSSESPGPSPRPRTKDGQSEDRPRTKDGQSEDRPRTVHGQTSDSPPSVRHPAREQSGAKRSEEENTPCVSPAGDATPSEPATHSQTHAPVGLGAHGPSDGADDFAARWGLTVAGITLPPESERAIAAWLRVVSEHSGCDLAASHRRHGKSLAALAERVGPAVLHEAVEVHVAEGKALDSRRGKPIAFLEAIARRIQGEAKRRPDHVATVAPPAPTSASDERKVPLGWYSYAEALAEHPGLTEAQHAAAVERWRALGEPDLVDGDNRPLWLVHGRETRERPGGTGSGQAAQVLALVRGAGTRP